MKLGKFDLTKIGSDLIAGANKNAPTLMSIGAVMGLGATVYLALKAKPKADDILKERAEKLAEIEEEFDGVTEEKDILDKKKQIKDININAVKNLGKVLWSPVLAGILTSSLIFGANHINLRRLADMSAMYEISSDALMRYKKKTEEVLGEKKKTQVEEEVDKDVVRSAVNDGLPFKETGNGSTPCIEGWSRQRAYLSRNFIDKTVNEVNNRINKYDFVSLNELYFSLGLEEVPYGDEVGWNINDSLIELRYTSELINDTPYLVFNFKDHCQPKPRRRFGDY